MLRHRGVVERNAPKPSPDVPSAEQSAIALLERSAVIAALRALPPRQREALVLRYYADLSEAQIASAMGISKGAVKSHAARGMSSLRTVLEKEEWHARAHGLPRRAAVRGGGSGVCAHGGPAMPA